MDVSGSVVGAAPGFFGKLPSHGDFVGRGLPPAVRARFDAWIQAGLLHSREVLGEAWLPAWLGSPLWRFVVAAGVCDERAWHGVMMPSHDRVGRCFPLLLAAGGPSPPSLRDCLTLHDGWFARLEELALAALEPGFRLEAFSAHLGVLPGLPVHPPGAAGAAASSRQRGRPGKFVRPLAPSSPALPDDEIFCGEGSAWWTTGSERLAPCLAACQAMPDPSGFCAFLDGQWSAHGWIVV